MLRRNIDNILMALFIGVFIIAMLGIILHVRIMTSIALCALTVVVGIYAAVQMIDFLSKDTVAEDADVKHNRAILVQFIVAGVIFLALLSVTIFHLCGKLF